DKAGKVRVKAKAMSRLRFGRLELVMNRKTIAVAEAGDDFTAEIESTIDVNETGWISARCFEPEGEPFQRNGNDGEITPQFMQRAATTPVYFTLAGKRRTSEEAKAFFDDRLKQLASFYKNKAKFPDKEAENHAKGQAECARKHFDGIFE
ncbi:hypothetical protein ACFL1X_08485, partial [Candidatus Hydrogenedentota bacterium]